MAIKQTVNFYQFGESFKQAGRADQFGGYKGLVHLFEYLENLSDEIGEDLELDVIALCCDYSHYDSVEDVISNYSVDLPDDWDELDEDDRLSFIEDWLCDQTSVVVCEDDCIIFASF